MASHNLPFSFRKWNSRLDLSAYNASSIEINFRKRRILPLWRVASKRLPTKASPSLSKQYLHDEDCFDEKCWAHGTVNSFFFLPFKTNWCLMIFVHSKSKFSLKRWIERGENAWLKRPEKAHFLEIWKVSIKSIIKKLFGGTIWRFSGIYFLFLLKQFGRSSL